MCLWNRGKAQRDPRVLEGIEDGRITGRPPRSYSLLFLFLKICVVTLAELLAGFVIDVLFVDPETCTVMLVDPADPELYRGFRDTPQ